MSTTTPNMQAVFSPPHPAHVDTNLPVNDSESNTLEPEERGKDVESKFWEMYKEVSNEHDRDFLERANGDMAIILTFAGLFSAVNSTFIIGMQPNPGDTTNVLMLQLITIMADGPNVVHDISNLSSSTSYPSSTVWIQTLAYASLAFSILAAFGAVMGKQWLSSFKAARGSGSLKEFGLQRQRKLDGLEKWYFQTILGTFFVLLQISLLLFGLSLSANMFIQQPVISSVIISATGLGFIVHLVTILISVWRPDSPFQTTGSASVRAVFGSTLVPDSDAFIPSAIRWILKTSTDPKVVENTAAFIPDSDMFMKSSAIRWILKTSTDPKVVENAAAMVPCVRWPEGFDVVAIYAHLVDNFARCVGRPESLLTYGKALTHLRIHSLQIDDIGQKEQDAWRSCRRHNLKRAFICDAFKDARLAHDQLENTVDNMANTRTILRTMIAHGSWFHPSLPDSEELIWSGDLRWRHLDGRDPSCEEFNWLIDYLVNLRFSGLDETKGDALLALSAMHGLGSSDKRSSYVGVLIHSMTSNRCSRVRHAALRAVSDAREELASLTDHSMVGLLDQLSAALLTAVGPNINDTMPSKSTLLIDGARNRCYLRLIFSLSKNDEWCTRLTRDGHVPQCNSLHDEVLASPYCIDKFLLAMILQRLDPSRDATQEKRWMLIKGVWSNMSNMWFLDREEIEALPALVTATRQQLTDRNDYKLIGNVSGVLHELRRDPHLLHAEVALDQAHARADAAQTVQDFYDELTSVAKHPDDLAS